ncbi:MAG: UDP-glucose 4-epimerase GalE [Saprospiraceae bacterium]|nr:UDP-glucose 4-epimerase GalE [Saprospiraceae bacterium]MCB9342464.1 UDP-glucose 4-epimerase GalE [Lewinellaceae bacterium]
MKILVTGGAGFIGSHTVVSLEEAGYEAVILDDFSNSDKSVIGGLQKILNKTVPSYAIDCRNYAEVRKVFREENIEGVIHFAASKAVGESMEQPLLYYQNNLGSLMTIIDVMLAEGISNLIFSSSCTVYGEVDELPVTENAPVKPAASVYGNTKQIGEEIIRDTTAAQPIKAISLRYFNPVGAHPSGLIGELPIGKPNNLVPFVTQTAIGKRAKVTVFGNDYPTPDGTCIRDYIHVMDLAEAHVAALKYLAKQSEDKFYDVFNIGTGNGNSVLELIHSFEKVSRKPLTFETGPRREGDITAVWADASKANKELGWKAKRTLDEALEDAWRWEQQLV